LASLAIAAGTDLTTSLSVSGEICSADFASASLNLNILVTSSASGAPATVTLSTDGGATFTNVGTISVWSQSGRNKSAQLSLAEVVAANTTTTFEVCAAQPGSNGNSDKGSCADVSVEPTCASYLPLTTVDYTAHGADFLVIGAWGNQADFTDMVNVATQMNKWAGNYNSNFVISVGPSFFSGGTYSYDGVKSVADPKFSILWENVYRDSTTVPALAALPWWLVVGNHDWYTLNSQLYEIQYHDTDPKWNSPDYFFVQRFALPNSKHATFIYINTELLFYGYAGKAPTDLATNFSNAGWTLANKTIEKQLAWIDKALEAANQDDYVFLIADDDLATCAGDNPWASATPSLMINTSGTTLPALIAKWQPTAYMNDHHHTLAYDLYQGTLYIQSGAGGNVDSTCAPVTGAVGNEYANTYGFAHAHLTDTSFTVEFVDETGVQRLNTSASQRTPISGQTASTTPLPPNGDPSIHAQ
jgi:hypothetical protein